MSPWNRVAAGVAGTLLLGLLVATQAFNGAGDTWTPTLINLFCYWLWEIPLAWVLAKPLALGPTGVFISVLVGFSTMALVSVAIFRRGGWKRVRV